MIHRSAAVLWRSTSRGPVVLVPGREHAAVLDGLGALVWELLDEPMTIDALAAAVAEAVGSRTRPDDQPNGTDIGAAVDAAVDALVVQDLVVR